MNSRSIILPADIRNMNILNGHSAGRVFYKSVGGWQVAVVAKSVRRYALGVPLSSVPSKKTNNTYLTTGCKSCVQSRRSFLYFYPRVLVSTDFLLPWTAPDHILIESVLVWWYFAYRIKIRNSTEFWIFNGY